MDKYQELKEHYNDIERHYVVREYTDKDIEKLSSAIRKQSTKCMILILMCAILTFYISMLLSRLQKQGDFALPGILEFLFCKHPLILPAAMLFFGLILYASSLTHSSRDLLATSMQAAAKKMGAIFSTTIEDRGILVQTEPVTPNDDILDWCARVLTSVIKVHPEATGEIHELMDSIRSNDKAAYTAAVIYTEILNDQLVQGNESFLENGETNFFNYRFFDKDECNITKYFN